MSKRPEQGNLIRVTEDTLCGGECEHICTVRDLLSSQFTVAYEWQRGDGGWNERVLFVRYADAQWDIAKQEWKGRAG